MKLRAEHAELHAESTTTRRFEPRLVQIDDGRWLVQVHPKTIEMFSCKYEYLCQVRWIGGKMDYSQGGLPLVVLKEMFKEANV